MDPAAYQASRVSCSDAFSCFSAHPSASEVTTLWRYTAYTQPFNGPLSGTTRVSWYQKGKTNLDFTEARDSEWQWHQLGIVELCDYARA